MVHSSLHKILFELQGTHTLEACFGGRTFPIISPWFTDAGQIPRENCLLAPFAAAAQLLLSTPTAWSWQVLALPEGKSMILTLLLMQPLQYNQLPNTAQQCTAATETHMCKLHSKLLLSAPLSYGSKIKCFTWLTERNLFWKFRRCRSNKQIECNFPWGFSLQFSPLHELPP